MLGAPSVTILAGPNGAGKSTVAYLLLPQILDARHFVNADEIARDRSPLRPERAALSAGREMLSRLHDLASRRMTFAFETTLASRHFAPWLARLIDDGYSFHLLFLWVPTPEFARARVESRVKEGGHDVPEPVVRRRYARGLHNFFALYQPLTTTWRMYDSSAGPAPRLIAAGRGRMLDSVTDQPTWHRIERGAHGEG